MQTMIKENPHDQKINADSSSTEPSEPHLQKSSFECKEKDKKPTLNIFWVGPPSTKSARKAANLSRSLFGHDTDALDNITQLENPIKFWCLAEFFPYYQDQLKNKAVTVCSIEKFLNESLTSSDEYTREHAAVILKVKAILFATGRGTLRDILTFKVFVTFFILATKENNTKATKGKYTLDSYFEIDPKQSFLPDFTRFFMPTFYQSNSGVGRDKKLQDCWIMYSPENDLSVARAMLSEFEKLFLEAEKKRRTYTDDLRDAYYNLLIGHNIRKALDSNYPDVDEKSNEENQWFCHAIEKNGEIRGVIPSLGIEKIFFNTHRDDGRYREILETNLRIDNVFFFKKRYHNEPDLRWIKKIIEDKHPLSKNCLNYITSELSIYSIINLFVCYYTGFGWRNHRARAREIAHQINKAEQLQEVVSILKVQSSLFTVKNERLDAPKAKNEKFNVDVAARFNEMLINKKQGGYYQTVLTALKMVDESKSLALL